MSIPVVGIGASEEGLEALKLLLAHLPADTGLAFVVQHLDPKHYSNLSEVSAIPVQQVTDRLEIAKPFMVIPPDVVLELATKC
jgi:two-component system CheB/CheR fusion protein